MALSRKQKGDLGRRLSGAESPTDGDLRLLEEVLLESNAALETVTAEL
jgi:hypothetical protein